MDNSEQAELVVGAKARADDVAQKAAQDAAAQAQAVAEKELAKKKAEAEAALTRKADRTRKRTAAHEAAIPDPKAPKIEVDVREISGPQSTLKLRSSGSGEKLLLVLKSNEVPTRRSRNTSCSWSLPLARALANKEVFSV